MPNHKLTTGTSDHKYHLHTRTHTRALRSSHTLGSGWRWAAASICSLLSLWQLITSRWKPHRCLTSHQPLSPPPPAAYPLFLPTLQSPSHTPSVSSFTPDFHYTRYFIATQHVFGFAALALFIYLSLSPLLAPLLPHFESFCCFFLKTLPVPKHLSQHPSRKRPHLCPMWLFSFFISSSLECHKSAAHWQTAAVPNWSDTPGSVWFHNACQSHVSSHLSRFKRSQFSDVLRYQLVSDWCLAD